jgi:hypothetical protein
MVSTIASADEKQPRGRQIRLAEQGHPFAGCVNVDAEGQRINRR